MYTVLLSVLSVQSALYLIWYQFTMLFVVEWNFEGILLRILFCCVAVASLNVQIVNCVWVWVCECECVWVSVCMCVPICRFCVNVHGRVGGWHVCLCDFSCERVCVCVCREKGCCWRECLCGCVMLFILFYPLLLSLNFIYNYSFFSSSFI